MASVLLLAVFLLSGSFPARAQDTRTDQAGSVLREYVDKGYCTYTYVVPPGSRTEGCTPPGQTTTSTAALELQLAETKEETGRLKNQVDRLSSLVEILLSQQSDLTSKVDGLGDRLESEQNMTRELQEKEARLQAQVQNLTKTLYEQDVIINQRLQCTCESLVPGGVVLTTARPPPDHVTTSVAEAGPIIASDCADHFASGQTTSGVYNIRFPHSDVEIYCDMDTEEGGWTVIQRRQDGSVPFNRNWEEYKQGFGDKNGEYWLGNENIHLLTNQKNYMLRVDLLDWSGDSRIAEYSTFRVSGESDQYRLQIGVYSGNAGDSMSYNNGQKFSTIDRDNDVWSGHCSQTYGQGGWWFQRCTYSYLNGRYQGNCGSSCPSLQGVVWYHWRGSTYSLKSVSMKIKPY